jgi:hypothetical protein
LADGGVAGAGTAATVGVVAVFGLGGVVSAVGRTERAMASVVDAPTLEGGGVAAVVAPLLGARAKRPASVAVA